MNNMLKYIHTQWFFFKKLLPRYIYLTRRGKKLVRAFCGLIIWVWLFLLGEFCQMVDRDGRQVLMCTWGKKSMEDEMDFTMFGDFEHGDLIDINVGDLEIKSLYKYGLFSAWQVLLFRFFFAVKKICSFLLFLSTEKGRRRCRRIAHHWLLKASQSSSLYKWKETGSSKSGFCLYFKNS